MRRNSVRKFIHAVLSVVPLLIIPIFALNILHKETEPISIEVQEKQSIDFNQYIYNGKGDTLNYWESETSLDIYNDISDGPFVQFNDYDNDVYTRCEIDILQYHKIYFKMQYISHSSQEMSLYLYDINKNINVTFFEDYQISSNSRIQDFNYIFNGSNDYNTLEMYYLNIFCTNPFNLKNVQIFDLTQMFGNGNEPTIEEFNSMFPNTYYAYTESQKMLVNKPNPTTYNSTDIGSQFVYALYKPVHDYFNFNNLFNMDAIYNWIELNLFSGTAPLPIFIIWNVLLYEFFIAIIYLLFSVFIFLIDFAQKCIESFYDKSSGGWRK